MRTAKNAKLCWAKHRERENHSVRWRLILNFFLVPHSPPFYFCLFFFFLHFSLVALVTQSFFFASSDLCRVKIRFSLEILFSSFCSQSSSLSEIVCAKVKSVKIDSFSFHASWIFKSRPQKCCVHFPLLSFAKKARKKKKSKKCEKLKMCTKRKIAITVHTIIKFDVLENILCF